MCSVPIKRLLFGVILCLTIAATGGGQAPSVATAKPRSSAANAQAPRLSAREMLVRAEQRSEELRAKLFDIQAKEFSLQSRLEDLNYRLTPEAIDRMLVFVSSVRPLDELRDSLRARLEAERARVNRQIELAASTREKLEAAIRECDAEIERLRQQLNTD